MLGYVAGAALWGMAKSIGFGAKRSHLVLDGSELLEEIQYRAGYERLGLRGLLNVNPLVARFVSAAVFGLDHPGNEIDAAFGGVLYSSAYDAGFERWGQLGGLAFAVVTHLAHNTGVWLGGTP